MARTLPLAVLVVVVVFGTGGARAGGILGPTTVAVGFGSVWVGLGEGHIIRLDPQTGVVQSRIPGTPTSFVHGLTVAYGAVWGVRGQIVRIDPARNRLLEVRGVGSATLFSVHPAAGALWTADDGTNEILRIAARRNSVSARIPVRGRVLGLGTGAHTVLVVGSLKRGPITGPMGSWVIRRLDPATNRVSRPLARVSCLPGIAVAAHAVWTVDECDGVLTRRDPRTLARTARLSVPRSHPVLVLGFGSVWLIGPREVLRIEPRSLRIVARVRAPGVAAAVGAGGVWVLDGGNGIRGRVRRIDPATNRVVKTFKVDAPS